VWEVQVYTDSNYPTEFNALAGSNKDKIDSLLEELVVINDPEDHRCAVDCPHIPDVYNAVKYQYDNVVLIVALERIMEGTDYEVDKISLYSCST